jgi:uncharacterized membrane protein
VSESDPFLVEKSDGDEYGRVVDAGRPIEWLKGGWELFAKNPGLWVGIGLVIMIVVLLGMIPMIGSLLVTFLMPILGAGLLLGCKALRDGGELRFDHLFAGFQQNTGNLVMIGVLSLFGFIAIGVVTVVIGGGAALSGVVMGDASGLGMALVGLMVAALVALALSVPLSMAIWFAPALVVFKNMLPIPAMKASFFACLKNTLPFLVYGLVVVVLAIVASIPLGLGWLLLVPVLICSHYTSYVDLFE